MTTTEHGATIGLDTAAELAAQLRVDSVRSATAAGSGHPTSSMSAADLLAVLVTRHLRYDWDQPRLPVNDHLIFSKGHASPLLYSVFKAVGVVSEDELLNGYRRFGQRLEGHPTPILPWVDVATGSLGQGLPDGVGVGLAGKYLDRLPYRVWVLTGDSELAEGSIWEAFDKASYYRLSNLIVMADINRLGQRGQTDVGWNLAEYARRMEAFGARVLTVDGHDLTAIDEAMSAAADTSGGQPTVILAKTIKGKGFSEVENKDGWHGKPFPPDMAERAIAELGGVRELVVRGPRPEPAQPGPVPDKPTTAPPPPATAATPSATSPRYEVGAKVATRKAYGDALVALGARDDRVVVLDGEVSNSTFADEFTWAYPDRYFEMFIAEQQLLAAASGLAARGYSAFASTFAAFFTRAYDFIRMGAISGLDLRLCGSHAGVEIGADGPSQMALEDLAMMRAVHGSTVLYPSDGSDGRHAWHQLPAHHARRLPGPVSRRGDVPGRRVQAGPLGCGRPGHAGRRRGDAARGPAGRRHPARRGHRRAGHRLLFGQAGGRGDAGRGRRGDRRADRGRRRPPPRRRPRLGRRGRAAGRGPAEPASHPPRGERDAGFRHRRGTARLGGNRRRPHR